MLSEAPRCGPSPERPWFSRLGSIWPSPWVGAAVHALRERGYFFGGALPRWFDSDGILMQKLLCPPDFDGIVLDSAESKQLLKIIRRDWERAEGGG